MLAPFFAPLLIYATLLRRCHAADMPPHITIRLRYYAIFAAITPCRYAAALTLLRCHYFADYVYACVYVCLRRYDAADVTLPLIFSLACAAIRHAAIIFAMLRQRRYAIIAAIRRHFHAAACYDAFAGLFCYCCLHTSCLRHYAIIALLCCIRATMLLLLLTRLLIAMPHVLLLLLRCLLLLPRYADTPPCHASYCYIHAFDADIIAFAIAVAATLRVTP